jgi:hypothetical protein
MHRRGCCSENEKSGHGVWKCIGWGILGVVGFAVVLGLLGLVIMSLWNWLMPVLFKLPAIVFWQAIGLAILSRLLFGGCGWGMRHMRGHHHGRHGHHERCGYGSEKECCSDKDTEGETGQKKDVAEI